MADSKVFSPPSGAFDITNPLNPLNPLSPFNPTNPLNPLNIGHPTTIGAPTFGAPTFGAPSFGTTAFGSSSWSPGFGFDPLNPLGMNSFKF